jgi:multiple sugar transport system ATP-binding protein
MTAPKLQLVDLKKEFSGGSVPAVDGINLTVAGGETVALLGPSGCGKSTTLNMIVGLEAPSSGDILIDGSSVIDLPPGRRDVGLVFQDYAVFTSMSVRENLAFGMKVRGVKKPAIVRAVGEVAELLGLTGMLDASARDLGSSELQRVAIGRTLVTRPSLLLLDEPLSNLEAATRLATRKELRRLQKEIGLTIVYVTHDQIEALSLADRVAVMNAGKIKQVEKASLICQQPDNLFVAGFMGSPPMNLLRGRLVGNGAGLTFVKGGFSLDLPRGVTPGEGHERLPAILGVRPEDIRLASSGKGLVAARVVLVEPRGSDAVLTVESGRQTMKVIVPSLGRPAEGAEVRLYIDPSSLVLFSGESDRRLSLFVEDVS